MPLYVLKCDRCGEIHEVISQIGEEAAFCPCGGEMVKQPTYPAMIKMKGEGGYPSRRKFVKGSAPYTTRQTKAWLDSEPQVGRS